ncbi:3-hydroxyisobutyrate dehydrogenase [Paraburkholderia unamae]|uniref:NAD(P)-dependent oxidoreductase n=1 Tax=Paraburkholderia unamae TaxID=219649 RepID=UPI001CB32494|nr:NAD(P)-dependent oxidoreductase [Paraburkholderia unamae]CAG9274441.1 3-hydroxyisobutyrate dehydrogenase [Paraburkholderia unamae]
MKQRIAVVGLGQMGGRIAGRLLDTGHRIGVFDTDGSRAQALAARGATPYANLRSLGSEHDVVLTVLPDADIVRRVVLDEGGLASGMTRSSLLIDVTTSVPSVTKEIAGALGQRGILMLDAPVSGGVQKAETGALTIMAGGDAAVLRQAMPVLQAIGAQVFHMGAIGTGHTAKALNNLITATTLAITSEAMALGVKLGVDAQTLLDVINAGSGRSAASETKFPEQILSRKFEPGFSMALMLKDVGIALAMARDAHAPAHVGAAVHALWKHGVDQGRGGMDHSAIALVVEEMAGVQIGADSARTSA